MFFDIPPPLRGTPLKRGRLTRNTAYKCRCNRTATARPLFRGVAVRPGYVPKGLGYVKMVCMIRLTLMAKYF